MSDRPVPGSEPAAPEPMSPPPDSPIPGTPIPSPPMPTPPDEPDPGRPQALGDGDIPNTPFSSPCSMPELR